MELSKHQSYHTDMKRKLLLTPMAASQRERNGFCRLTLIWPHAATMRLMAATTVGCAVNSSSGEVGLYGALSEGKSKSDLASGGVPEERPGRDDFGGVKWSEHVGRRADFGVCFGVTGENADVPGAGDDGGVVNGSAF
jgi:hypothetical protein